MNRSSDVQNMLAARGLTLSCNAQARIIGLTQEFCGGELWCIVGPNGAGKTTLIHTLAGLHAPEQGTIELDDRNLSDWSPMQLAQRRALMPQTVHDVFQASVFETVLLSRVPHRSGWCWGNKEDEGRVRAALAQFDLAPLANRDITTLSGGERQRVALAAALCQDAPLLLLDEPLAHLDILHQVKCLQYLQRWVKTAPISQPRLVIFSCHDLNLARRFATHALLLDGKGAVQQGFVCHVLTPTRLHQALLHPFIRIHDNTHEALIPALTSDSNAEEKN